MKKAFTLIELIIAIIIFWVGLLAILVVLNKNVTLAKNLELKTQATLLAKEGIELVYNLRDSNNIKYLPWNYLTWSPEQIKTNSYAKFQTGKMYIPIILLTWNKIVLRQISDPKSARLFLQTGNFLNQAWETIYSWFFYNYFTWEKTPFYRYVIFSWFYLQPENSTKPDKILKLVSKVWYIHWSLTREVVFESAIADWR